MVGGFDAQEHPYHRQIYHTLEDARDEKEYVMDDDDDEWIQEKGVSMHESWSFQAHCP